MSEEILELSYNRPFVKPYVGMKISYGGDGNTKFGSITDIDDKVWVLWADSPQPYSNKNFERYLRDGTFKRE